jgi:hypothetical protein
MILFGWKLRHPKGSGYDLRLETLPQLEDFGGDIVYKIVDITMSKDRNELMLTQVYYLVVRKRGKKQKLPEPTAPITTVQLSLDDFHPITEPEKFRMPSHCVIYSRRW